MKTSSTSAIQGMNFSNAWKYCAIVWTQIQPTAGMKNWKNANVPAIKPMRGSFIFGSFMPLASETEKASIARPTPKRMLLKKKRNPQSIKTLFPRTKGELCA